jgi:hypothetical protein
MAHNKRLERAARRLGKAAAGFDETVEAEETYLRNLDLGVRAGVFLWKEECWWPKQPPGLLERTRKEPAEAHVTLWFTEHDGQWGLWVKKAVWHVRTGELLEDAWRGLVRLRDAPRDTRIAAAQHFDVLEEELRKAAGRTARALWAARRKAGRLLS